MDHDADTFNIKTGSTDPTPFASTDILVLNGTTATLTGSAGFDLTVLPIASGGSSSIQSKSIGTGATAKLLLETNVMNPSTGTQVVQFKNPNASFYIGMDIGVTDTDLYWNTSAAVGTSPSMSLTSSGTLTVAGKTTDAGIAVVGGTSGGSAQFSATATTGGIATLTLTSVGAGMDAYTNYVTGATNNFTVGVVQATLQSLSGNYVVSKGNDLSVPGSYGLAVTSTGDVHVDNKLVLTESGNDVLATNCNYSSFASPASMKTTKFVTTGGAFNSGWGAGLTAADLTYSNVPVTTNGNGSGAQFTIEITTNAVSVGTCTMTGEDYRIGDTITIAGSSPWWGKWNQYENVNRS